MGHIRLGVLPKSRKWQQVVERLRLGADVADVAGLAADAAETSLKGASNDPAFLHAFWLLTQIPLAARGPAFAEDLVQISRIRLLRSAAPPCQTIVTGNTSFAVCRINSRRPGLN